MPSPTPPQSEQELLARAHAIAGFTLAQLAAKTGIKVPRDLRRDKGWVGQLIEWQLGASAGSRPEQDFPELGIELKTIPVDPKGKPLETTFVCVAPLVGISGQRWEDSNVRNKLSRVLWIPVEGSRDIPIGERRVGMPLLWIPSAEENALLRQDWEELMDMIVLGEVEQISARHGQVMQLRPKAANSKALTRAIGRAGQPIMTLPRGFYLKIPFTHALLMRHFALPK
ncbi:DNA mismatch repair endonuclease MutH [Aeromonas molluscorum]|jgi:DNA mismatch repair protein MutH|uniref:DNA mismatch repair endonuclease MutH n=1 Tax=Aeromonas molluscorum TaxID=271417 RepID=UPI003F1BF4F0